MLSWIDIHRMDCSRQAEELRQFAQSTEIEACTKHFGRDVVNALDPRKTSNSTEKVVVLKLESKYICRSLVLK